VKYFTILILILIMGACIVKPERMMRKMPDDFCIDHNKDMKCIKP
jgi:hypothetical protein